MIKKGLTFNDFNCLIIAVFFIQDAFPAYSISQVILVVIHVFVFFLVLLWLIVLLWFIIDH